jgi:hypothetical protein
LTGTKNDSTYSLYKKIKIMKTLTLLSLFSIISSAGIFATPDPGIPERIQKLFHEEFPKIENPVFYRDPQAYIVYFKKDNNSAERVYYNLDAELILTIKYYTENELGPFIRQKVNSKYKGKKIISVTEVQSVTEHFYQIILQGDKRWCVIKSDTRGSMQIQKRWKGNA